MQIGSEEDWATAMGVELIEDPCQMVHDCASDAKSIPGNITDGYAFGAPGRGLSAMCVCGRAHAKIGRDYYPIEFGVHILSVGDVI